VAGTSNYPGALDDFAETSPTNLGDPDITGRTHSERHDDIETAVQNIEIELGTNPSGVAATVGQRIANVEGGNTITIGSVSTTTTGVASASMSGTYPSQTLNLTIPQGVQGSPGVPGSLLDPAVQQFSADGSVLRNLPARVIGAEQLLKQAVWWIDAGHSSASAQSVSNLGWGGSVLNAQVGSSSAADSNDPRYLDWDGQNYVYLPGVNNNSLTVPDAAPLDITGDIDVRVRVAMDDWTPAATNVLLGKWADAGNQRGYAFMVNTNGTLNFWWSTDGSGGTFTGATSTAATGLADGETKWIRGTRVASTGAVNFFMSDDGVTWTALGSAVVGSTGAFFANNQTLHIGALDAASLPSAGKVYRAQVCNGIDSPPVLDVDCSQIGSGSATSFTALTGQTVTINRSTSGRKSVAVTHPLWLFGTDDYMEVPARWLEHTGTNYVYLPGVSGNTMSVPDAAALDITGDLDLRARVALDDWTPAGVHYLIGKWTGGQQSYIFSVETSGALRLLWTTDGSTTIFRTSTAGTGLTDGAVKWVRATLDVDNGASGHDVKFWTSDDGSTWTQLGTTITTAGTTSVFSGTAALAIGSQLTGTSAVAGKVYRAQVYNGIGGTLVLDVDTSVITGDVASFTAATGQTVTINRAGTTYQSVGVTTSGYLRPGNPDSFTAAPSSLLDFGATDSMTVLVFSRWWNDSGATSHTFIAKAWTASDDGWQLWKWSGLTFPFFDINPLVGSRSDTVGSATLASVSGTVLTLAGTRDGSSGAQRVWMNGTAGTAATQTGSTVTPRVVRIGADPTGPFAYLNAEVYGAAIFRRVLTASEMTTLTNYFAGRVG